MRIHRAYKTELDPTCKQVVQLRQHAGCARWAYNWGLRRKQEVYEATGKRPSAMDLHKELTLLKRKKAAEGGVPWLYSASKCAAQEALRNLDAAFKNFFCRCKQAVPLKGFPQFKSRKNGVGNFKLLGAIKVEGSGIQLPVLGRIGLKQSNYLPVSGVKILSATVSETAGRWFVSLQVEEALTELIKSPCVLGVDVGISRLAVTSDSEVFKNPKALASAQKSFRSRQKAVARKKKGSSNRKKAVARLARTHYRVANVRKDAIHKMTTAITKRSTTLVIEDLNVAGMMKNHKLARALSDASLAEIHRQLEYKSKWYGVELIKADRFYPSTKTCSRCGNVRVVLLSERTYCCDKCGLVMDRDLNAAINLKKLAGSSPVSAYCPDSSGLRVTADETVGWVGTELVRRT